MYHICPARCQTQFIRAERPDRGKGRFPSHSAEFAVKLAATVFCRLARMDEGKHLAFGDRLLDLGTAENNLSGLVGQSERAERRIGDQAVHVTCKTFRNLDFRLQSAGENIALCSL